MYQCQKSIIYNTASSIEKVHPLLSLHINIHQHVCIELFWTVLYCKLRLICAYFSPDSDKFFIGDSNIMDRGLVKTYTQTMYKRKWSKKQFQTNMSVDFDVRGQQEIFAGGSVVMDFYFGLLVKKAPIMDFCITNVQLDEIYGHYLSGIVVVINVVRFYVMHYTNVSDFQVHTLQMYIHQFY